MPGFKVAESNAFMDFEGFGFYKAHFNLIIPWGLATAIASFIQLWALIFGLWSWHSCQLLWEAPRKGVASGQDSQELERLDLEMNWEWLRD
jgi:hypothetical protein